MNASEIRKIIGTTTFSDEQLEKSAQYFERVTRKAITPEMHSSLKDHIARKESSMAPKPKFVSAMYGDNRTEAERKMEDQGEQGEP